MKSWQHCATGIRQMSRFRQRETDARPSSPCSCAIHTQQRSDLARVSINLMAPFLDTDADAVWCWTDFCSFACPPFSVVQRNALHASVGAGKGLFWPFVVVSNKRTMPSTSEIGRRQRAALPSATSTNDDRIVGHEIARSSD